MFAAVMLVGMTASTAAQETTATISGAVVDSTNAALPGATVTVRNVETSGTRVLVTDDSGRYHAQGLSPGNYAVTVELPGFQTMVREGISLSTGQQSVINITMSVGGVQERIVVSGSVSLVETTQSSVANLVDDRQIRELPLNGRDFSQLTLLQPGVTATSTVSRSLDRGMGTQVSVGGARPNQISYLLDGADMNSMGNQSPGSAAGGLLGVETVREFQVLVNNYSAEYGRSAGGIVSAVTRSGTNTLHGSVFEFHRNDALDSKNYFDPEDEPIPALTRNQFGGFVGGPIKRDKIFFFGSYEGLRQDRGLSLVARVPSTATRNRTDVAPSIQPYLNLYPLPNADDAGQSGLYVSTATEPTDEDFVVAKVDISTSASDMLSMRYTHDDAEVFVPDALQRFGLRSHTKSQYFLAEYKKVVGSSLLNMTRFAWNRPLIEELPEEMVAIDPALYFLPNGYMGVVGVTGLNSLGPDTGAPSTFDYKSLQVTNTLTVTHGRHTIKTGFSFQRWFNDNNSTFTIGGNYTFTSIDNFVRGRTNRFEGMTPGSTTDREWRQSLVGVFIQDDFTVSSRLTVNAGMRYEFSTVPTETGGRYASLPDLYDTEPTAEAPFYENPSLRNFAPRAGFAWDLFGDGTTSLRGGAGYFFEPVLTNVTRTYMNRMPPYFLAANIRNPPFPSPYTGEIPTRLRLDLFPFEPDNPYRLQYNLTLQRELLPQLVVTAGYVGSRGIHQIRNIEWNQAIPVVQADGRYFFPPGQQRRNPAFESMRLRPTDGDSWYNGLLVGASKRFSEGLMMQASYTFAKSTDTGSLSVGSADFANGSQPRLGDDPEDNKGPSDFDVRHNFVFNYSYDLPFGQGLTGVVGALAHGWQLAGIVALHTGVPFNPLLGFDRANALPRSGGGGQRPNWGSGRDADDVIQGGTQQYFDPTAFLLPETGYFGDVGRNVLTGPGYASWDMSINKNFTMGGDRRLQFRFEVFNVLNRANFDLPEQVVFDASGLVENAGEITGTASDARQVQLGVKFLF
jgi:hypothetical protein